MGTTYICSSNGKIKTKSASLYDLSTCASRTSSSGCKSFCTCKSKSRLIKRIKDESLNFLVEVSPDEEFENRIESVEWFFGKLKNENIKFKVEYKILHRKIGEFYIHVVYGLDRKIVFSSSEWHVDAVTGSFVNKENFPKIIDHIGNFVEMMKI